MGEVDIVDVDYDSNLLDFGSFRIHLVDIHNLLVGHTNYGHVPLLF